MIIIKMMGGLGNQMFQYALGRKLTELGRNVKFDTSYYEQIPDGDTARTLELSRFGILLPTVEAKEIRRYDNNFQTVLDIVGNLLKIDISKKIVDQGRFIGKVLTCDDKYLIGYWQTDKYFKDIRQKLLLDFDFNNLTINGRSDELRSEILNNNNSVSVHVRGGDYFLSQNIENFGNICTPTYYKRAFEYFESRLDNPVFYLFTNDLKWVENNLDLKEHNVRIIDSNSKQDAIIDMYLMSLCRYNIIANSSFSWWGAWLNKNCEKIVIAPSKWGNLTDYRNTVPVDWVKLEG